LWLLVLGCSSSRLSPDARDSAADEPEASSHQDAPEPRECGESLSRACHESYERCLPKDPNGCANLNLCFKRCSALSCAQDCGGYWAISPEAREFFACLTSDMDACFDED
jgi:hypothetical protein